MPEDLAAAIQLERGPSFADRAWQPCPNCGVPDAVMRNQETKRPIVPSPLIAVGQECLSCQDLADKSESLAEEMGGQDKRLPPWVRVVMEPAPPEEDDEDEDDRSCRADDPGN